MAIAIAATRRSLAAYYTDALPIYAPHTVPSAASSQNGDLSPSGSLFQLSDAGMPLIEMVITRPGAADPG